MKKLFITLLILTFSFLIPDFSVAQWNACNNGITIKKILSFSAYKDTLYAGTAGKGVFMSVDNALSWKPINNGMDSLWVRSIAVNDKYIYATCNTYGVFVTTDRGKNWVRKNTGLLDTTVSKIIISGNNLICGTSRSGIFVSTDNGDNWDQKSNGITTKLTTGILALYLNNDTIYAGAQSKSFDSTEGGFYLSNDNCETWTDKTGDNLSHFLNIRSIVIRDDVWYIGTLFGGIYKTTDKGTTWIRPDTSGLNIPLSYPIVNAMAVNNDIIVLGSGYNGIFLWSKNHWKEINFGNKFTLPSSLTFYKEYLYLASDSGLHRINFNLLDINDNVTDLKSVVFPNPATDYIEISVGSGSKPDRIIISDVFGEQIILTPALSKGEGVKINVSLLSPGVYFVRIGDRVMKFMKY